MKKTLEFGENESEGKKEGEKMRKMKAKMMVWFHGDNLCLA